MMKAKIAIAALGLGFRALGLLPPKKGNFMTATITDYFINFITSKINWAAGVTVGLIVTWISTRFGLTIPTAVADTVTGWIAAGGFALVGILRTFFNSPHVASKQPAIVKKF